MKVEYLIVGGEDNGSIITRDSLVKKVSIIKKLSSSSMPSSFGQQFDVFRERIGENEYAYIIQGSHFGADIKDIINSTGLTPIPKELL